MNTKTHTTIKLLGRGGFGKVEEIRDDQNRVVAKKTFLPAYTIDVAYHDKLRKRFKREVETQRQLGGNEIIPIIDFSMSGDSPWFTMPLAEKLYQDQIVADKKSGKVDIDAIADILNALQFLHQMEFVHRDLNPRNILKHDGKWKLSDFGAVLPPTGNTATLTEDTIIYTEQYCAPEQRRDFHASKPSADVYSFGCILHDLFGDRARTPYGKHSAPGPIGLIIEKCTEQAPERRPSIRVLRGLVLDI